MKKKVVKLTQSQLTKIIMESIKTYIKETQIEIPMEKIKYNSFDEWIDSIPLDDEYVFESVEFYDNPYNIKQNPEQKTDKNGRLIEYKEDSLKIVKWGELKQEMKNVYGEKGNVYELGKEYGYPYGSTNPTLKLGNASKYYFFMKPEGNLELRSNDGDGHYHEWNNYDKVGDNGWTRESYRGYYDSVSSGRLD
jgi:hypothetical protein